MVKSPRERRAAQQRRLAVLMLISALSVGGFFGAMALLADNPELDPDTLCPTDPSVGPVAYHTVVIDATDTYSDVQREAITRHFRSVRDSVPKFGKLSLFTVSDRLSGELRPRLQLCNPGDGQDVSAVNANPEQLRRRWEESFLAPIEALLDSLIIGEPSPRSPIMETIQATAISSFPVPGTEEDSERRLIVFSDLLQHSEVQSQYATAPPTFSEFQRTTGYRQVRARLAGVEVRLYYVRRPSSLSDVQRGPHMEFWREYFEDQGAVVARVLSIEG